MPDEFREGPRPAAEQTPRKSEMHVSVDTRPAVEPPTVTGYEQEVDSVRQALAAETPPVVSDSKDLVPVPADYDATYAEVASSRFGKGGLAHHDAAAITSASLPENKNASVLEIGCNQGELLAKIKATGNKVVGIDINPAAVKQAQEIAPAVPADARNMPFKADSFDVILSLHTAEHIPEPKKLFAEIARILKPGGTAHLILPPNFYGLETIRVAKETMPKGTSWLKAWAYARQLHCTPFGTPFGGAIKQIRQTLEDKHINLSVSGGRRLDLNLASLIVLRKPAVKL